MLVAQVAGRVIEGLTIGAVGHQGVLVPPVGADRDAPVVDGLGVTTHARWGLVGAAVHRGVAGRHAQGDSGPGQIDAFRVGVGTIGHQVARFGAEVEATDVELVDDETEWKPSIFMGCISQSCFPYVCANEKKVNRERLAKGENLMSCGWRHCRKRQAKDTAEDILKKYLP